MNIWEVLVPLASASHLPAKMRPLSSMPRSPSNQGLDYVEC